MTERSMNTNATELKAPPQPNIKYRSEYKRSEINYSCNSQKNKKKMTNQTQNPVTSVFDFL